MGIFLLVIFYKFFLYIRIYFSLNNINKFANKNNINLSSKEINNIFNLLQDKNILDYSDDAYLELINNNIESNNTKKVYKLLMEYKKKYQNYL